MILSGHRWTCMKRTETWNRLSSLFSSSCIFVSKMRWSVHQLFLSSWFPVNFCLWVFWNCFAIKLGYRVLLHHFHWKARLWAIELFSSDRKLCIAGYQERATEFRRRKRRLSVNQKALISLWHFPFLFNSRKFVCRDMANLQRFVAPKSSLQGDVHFDSDVNVKLQWNRIASNSSMVVIRLSFE